MRVSVVVLTCNRPDSLRTLLRHLSTLTYPGLDVIIVDNSEKTEFSVEGIREEYGAVVSYLKQDVNLGATGRNVGLAEAKGDIIVTIDDDILGMTEVEIMALVKYFDENKEVGAVCFKVINPHTKLPINWCHHRRVEDFSNRIFKTDEITEGAVAFRKTALDKSGLYPDYFFISHEGPDLVLRLMDAGYDVIYNSEIVVEHHHSSINRKNWRRYYYDTRNLIWLAVRNFPIMYSVKFLSKGVLSMLVYSIRDGFLFYWFKGIFDGIIGLGRVMKDRKVVRKETLKRLAELKQFSPGFFYLIKKRLFQKNVQI